MDASNFDEFSRALASGTTRRRFVALVASIFVGLRGRDAWGAQLAPAACGQAGAVCTMLAGCCEGFTCVTSTINVNYGVCATGGDGGTVAGTTSLISPFSEGAEQQVAGATTDTTSTTTTDPQAEREARIAEHKARKDAHRNKIQSRKNEQQSRQEDKHDDRVLARGPDVDISVSCPLSGAQIVTINNQDTVDVSISKISSIINLIDDEPFTPTDLAAESGTTRQLVFGVNANDVPSGAIWISDSRIFENSELEGARIELSTGHVRRACCDGTTTCLGTNAKKHKNQNNKSKNNRHSRHKAKARKNKKHKKG